MLIINRLIKLPKGSFFLLGPRGTGKTTFIEAQFPTAQWVNLLLPEVYRSYLARPERLLELIAGHSDEKLVIVIDEVQKAPSLLSVVHSVIEQKLDIKFILTGSSARKLQNVSANLLGGRAVKRSMHPFSAAELKENFNLENALQFGLLPIVWSSLDPQDTLNAYIHLYLQEEIGAEGLVRKLEDFSRFLEVISFSHGAVLNVTNVAREAEVKRKTVENYITILLDLSLAFELPVFTKRAQRKLIAHAKFYIFDCGVYRSLRPRGPLDRAEEIHGMALEGLVAQNLVAWRDSSDKKFAVYFWRTVGGLEVDFIVYGEEHFLAIEVKNSLRVHETDTKALQQFLIDYPSAKAYLLYRGKEKLKIKNVICLPVEEFLMHHMS
jgi:predicted AAA+ superfamily ATPase